MKQNVPAVIAQLQSGTAPGAREKWDVYRSCFLKLIEEEARLQIVAGKSSAEIAARTGDALEDAMIRVECARLIYNDSRDILAGALWRRVEAFEPEPAFGSRIRCVARVAELLRECRGSGERLSADDKRAAERIISTALALFLEQQHA